MLLAAPLSSWPLLLALAAPDAATGPRSTSVVPFRTEVSPRVDPVFGDVASVREAIDQFLALQGAMEKIRDEFSTAVHDTLAQLTPLPGRPAPKTCPHAVTPTYAKAMESGRRFLALGRRLEARFREIRRADELGDTIGLTPDYRFKTKRVRDLYTTLLRDYREMKFAFYDQLGAELRHAGCKQPGATPLVMVGPLVAAEGNGGTDPADPTAWELETDTDAAGEPKPSAGAKPAPASPPEMPAPGQGPAIWIEIDNSRCAQPSRLVLDGLEIAEIAGQKKISVRTKSGPHELCVLPTDDKRVCGAPGTVRRAYLYEGWTLAVRCK